MPRRFVSTVRAFAARSGAALAHAATFVFHLLGGLASLVITLVSPLALRLWQRMRHPSRRDVLLALATPPVLLVLYVLLLIPFTPSIRDIRKARVDEPARILSADGKLLAEYKPSNREWVELKDISPHMVDALVSTEDHRFYEHHGIDLKRTAGAALHTFSGDRQGGSTITQQLARNLYPDEIGRAPTLARKIKEAITALKIEFAYSKPQILETYLNTVPFLYNAYGIEMAARTYFGESASDLDVLQSATLTGMLKGNSYYNPVINPERALQRRNTVLGQMVKYGKLSQAQFDSLKRRPLRIDFERQKEPPGPAPHFTEQLRKWLIAWADRNDYNIYSDGLVVHTTIDSRLQSMATAALTLQANALQNVANGTWNTRGNCAPDNDLFRTFIRESTDYRAARDAGQSDADALAHLGADKTFLAKLCRAKADVQAGFLAIDPRNGQIRAWVGSRDFTAEPFDHVQQARRQPGSTFKPFVYGAAFANGAKPDDSFIDQPVEIPVAGGEVWRPDDDAPPSGKPVTLRDALAYSRNRITAQLMQTVGPDKVANLAHAMGVRDSRLDAVPSLALGTSPVTIKEMVSAYATIANDGAYREPRMVTSIEDKAGNVLAEFAPAPPQAALPVAADRTLLDTMRGVVNRGTGAAIRSRFGSRADVAGKTGTTQDNADGWFILMQPQLVVGAWVGFDDGRVAFDNYYGEGAHSALPIVGDFFQRAIRARLIDARARFDTTIEPSAFEQFRDKLRAWVDYVTQSKPDSTTGAARTNAAPKPGRPAPSPSRNTPTASASVTSHASETAAVTPETSGSPRSGATFARPGLPPILGASSSHNASSAAAQSGPASAYRAPMPGASAIAPSANVFPAESDGASPTPTPDAPEPASASGQ